jgi:O-succinylbenzoate synthase
MKIERVEQLHVQMRLKQPFETSFGREEVMEKIIIAAYSEGLVGYGESPVEKLPLYSYETVETAWHAQRDALIPLLLDAQFERAADLPGVFAGVRGHNMAKAGIEAAVWDLEAQQAGVSVAALVGGTRPQVEVGVSIGIQPAVGDLLERVASYRAEGYGRIKVKIKPGWDADVVAVIREHFPDIRLMADANSAYTLADAPMLRRLDGLGLLMIEQPLQYDDLIDHAALQREIETPVCLDESITSLGRARDALALKACLIINIKPARVGGIAAAKATHDLCADSGVPVWCGGMLETGIGRAHNLAVAALPNFTLPGDISASDRYWHEDIVEPEFRLNPDGTMDVPRRPGIGVEVIRERLDRVTARRAVYPERP